MYNLVGNHPIWGDNIQMTPKPMKIIQQNESQIQLRGYGYDRMGFPFAGYGLTLNISNGDVEKITLHMYDRNVEITYLKA